ncbi:hypothetical protein Hanom_Chr09g00760631 [Helianthus anomalus]
MEKQTIWMELEAGSKLAKKPKHQGVKWLFLKVWSKTVKVTDVLQNTSFILCSFVRF